MMSLRGAERRGNLPEVNVSRRDCFADARNDILRDDFILQSNSSCYNFFIKNKRILLAFAGIFLFLPESFAAAPTEKHMYDPGGRRDPFTPLIAVSARVANGLIGVETLEDINVEGVVYDKAGSIVIVNGTIMKEGEELGSVKVIAITRDGAKFSVNGVEGFKPVYQERKKV